MIRTIDKEHLDIYKKVCTQGHFDINVYTIESNAKMIAVEILYHKKELTVDDAFYFGRAIQSEIDDKIMDKVYAGLKKI